MNSYQDNPELKCALIFEIAIFEALIGKVTELENSVNQLKTAVFKNSSISNNQHDERNCNLPNCNSSTQDIYDIEDDDEIKVEVEIDDELLENGEMGKDVGGLENSNLSKISPSSIDDQVNNLRPIITKISTINKELFDTHGNTLLRTSSKNKKTQNHISPADHLSVRQPKVLLQRLSASYIKANSAKKQESTSISNYPKSFFDSELEWKKKLVEWRSRCSSLKPNRIKTIKMNSEKSIRPSDNERIKETSILKDQLPKTNSNMEKSVEKPKESQNAVASLKISNKLQNQSSTQSLLRKQKLFNAKRCIAKYGSTHSVTTSETSHSTDEQKSRQVLKTATPALKRKRVRCGFCDGCTSDDCKVCRFCKDMPKYGGKGKLRQTCVQRSRCERPKLPSSASCVVCHRQQTALMPLRECVHCYEIMHLHCAREKCGLGLPSIGLPNSWQCAKCIKINSKRILSKISKQASK